MDGQELIDTFVTTLEELYQSKHVLDATIADMDRLGISTEWVGIQVAKRDQKQASIDE